MSCLNNHCYVQFQPTSYELISALVLTGFRRITFGQTDLEDLLDKYTKIVTTRNTKATNENTTSVDVSIPNIEAKLLTAPPTVSPIEFANPTSVDFFSYCVSVVMSYMFKTLFISSCVTVCTYLTTLSAFYIIYISFTYSLSLSFICTSWVYWEFNCIC